MGHVSGRVLLPISIGTRVMQAFGVAHVALSQTLGCAVGSSRTDVLHTTTVRHNKHVFANRITRPRIRQIARLFQSAYPQHLSGDYCFRSTYSVDYHRNHTFLTRLALGQWGRRGRANRDLRRQGPRRQI